MNGQRSLRCLIISDQLIPGVSRHGACYDVFQMTRDCGSVYLESDFATESHTGTFDLVLISGHANDRGSFIDIDGVELSISKHLATIRSRVVYLNACDAGQNADLIAEYFTTFGAEWVVAPVSEVPWGKHDNAATRTFAHYLLAGLDVTDAVPACDRLWPAENPYRVFRPNVDKQNLSD